MRPVRWLVPVTLLLALEAVAEEPGREDPPPVCRIAAPAEGSVILPGRPLSLSGTVTDPGGDPASLRVQWSSDRGGELGSSKVGAGGAVKLDVPRLDPGAHTLQLRATDPAGGSCEAKVRVRLASPPTLQASAPREGLAVNQGEAVTLEAAVSDPDEDPGAVKVRWTSDRDGELGSAKAGGGAVRLSTDRLSAGAHTLTAVATDSQGLTAQAVAKVSVNAVPTCSISPVRGGTSPVGAALRVSAAVSDKDDAPASLTATWSSSNGGSLGTSPVQAGAAVLETDRLAAGDHELSLTVADPRGARCVATTRVRVVSPPRLEVSAPRSGDVLDLGKPSELVLRVSDPDEAPSALKLSVRSSRDGALAGASAGKEGEARVSLARLTAGEHTLTVTATDAQGLSAEQAVGVRVNAPPSAPKVSIGGAPRTDDDVTVRVEAESVDPEKGQVTYRYRWEGPGGSADGATLPAAKTKAGEKWTATVTPSDGRADGPAATASVTIANTPPRLGAASVSPANPATGDALECSATGSEDADGDAVSLTYAWSAGAASLGTGKTLAASATSKGQSIVCRVTPGDASSKGEPAASAPVTVRNTPPTLSSAALVPAEAFGGQDLTCRPGAPADEDKDPVQLRFAWTIDGRPAGEGSTLSGKEVKKGQKIACAVTPFDGEASGAPATASLAVRNAAPKATSATLSPARPSTGDDLTCAAAGGSDADGDPVSFRYQWLVDGVAASQTGATLPASATSRGQKVQCVATPTDGELEGAPVRSAVVEIANTPPTAASVSVSPANPSTADALECTATGGSDLDGDPVSFTYEWSAGGAAIGTGRTLAASATRKGQSILCRATPSDGQARGAAVASAPVQVRNTAPALASAELAPGSVSAGQAVSCRGGSPSDADGDSVQLRYSWTVDGRAAGEGAQLSGKDLRKGQKVACAVTPFDGEESGAAATASLVVKNAPPKADSATLSPANPSTSDSLTCAGVGGSDPDGDSVSFRYQWLVDGSPVAGDGPSLAASATSRGQRVQCVATPLDGEAEGAGVRSAVVAIANTPPSAGGATLGPADPRRGATLACAGTGGSDADGDPVSFRFAWEVNGRSVAGAGATLSTAGLKKGDQVVCAATPFDGTAAGGSVRSAAVSLRNTPPELARATLSPAVVSASTELSCAPSGGSDADGDPLTYSYTWLRGGSPIPGQSGPTLPGGVLRRDDSVACMVTPSDGLDSGSSATSAAVTVKNSPPKVESVTLTPADVATDGRLTARADTSDPDRDDVRLTWRWFLDGKALSETSDTLDGAAFAKNQRVEAEATPSDGSLGGGAVRSSPVVVRNTPPTRPAAMAHDPRGGRSDLTCTLTQPSTDLDGDPLTYQVTWRVGGKVVPGTTTKIPGDTIPATQLRVNEDWTCSLAAFDGQDAGPEAVADVTVIRPTLATGSAHTCALETDGKVSCWGTNALEQLSEPTVDNFRVLSSSAWHTCGVRRDGSAACWGYNSYGQSFVPEGKYLDISAGAYHTCAILADGNLSCWGTSAGRVNQPPAGRFQSVVSGWSHSCALTPAGVAQCWGENKDGQASPPSGPTFTELSAGEQHTCGITTQGSILCWGNNSRGQTQAPSGTFVTLTSGGATNCATAQDGRVACWGANDFDQARPPSQGFWNVDCSNHHCCGWTDSGTVKCWGRNDYSQCTPPASLSSR